MSPSTESSSPPPGRGPLVGAGAVLALAALLSASPSGRAEGPFEVNIGSLAPKGTPWMDLLEKMETRIEKESGGKVNVILRPPSTMDEVQLVRETRKGESLQGCGVTTAAIADGGEAPQLSLIELPFLFRDNAEADRVLDQVLWSPLDTLLRERGLVMALWAENGWRSFATRGAAIRTPEDLQKLTMRAQESPVHRAMYEALGARSVEKPMTDVQAALQAGEIDGLDNTALFIQSGGLAQTLDYYTLSRHIYQPALVVYSKRWFDTVPPDLQQVLLATRDMAAEGRKAIRAEEQSTIAGFELIGVEVIELEEASRKAFADKAKSIHDRLAAGVTGGPELLAKVRAALAQPGPKP